MDGSGKAGDVNLVLFWPSFRKWHLGKLLQVNIAFLEEQVRYLVRFFKWFTVNKVIL